MGNKDVYVNVIGGLRVNEPASDLAMAMAIVSDYKDMSVPEDTVIIGEVGLTGNIRSVPRIQQRVSEAAKMGFKRFVIPVGNEGQCKGISQKGSIITVRTVQEAIAKIFK